MSNLWERFESIVSAEEVQEAKTMFEPIVPGDYKVILEEIAPSESQAGLPMVKGKFRTVENNRVIFYNQMLQNLNNPKMTAVNVAEAVTFIGGLVGDEIQFIGLGQLAVLIEGLPVGQEYTINVSYGAKDYDMKFPKLKVVAKEGVEDDMPF